MEMCYRELGSSGMRASVVGLGTFAIGGWFYGGTDRKAAIEAIKASLDEGINLIDTAPIYGFGRAEEIVGEAIRGARDKVLLATKCGLVWDTREGVFHTYADDAAPTGAPSKYAVYQHLGPETIVKEVERSLRRLGTDYIDLYQTHWQDATTPIDVTLFALSRLKEQGKIRAIGVSNINIEQLEQYKGIVSVQEKYSLIDRTSEKNGVIDYCIKKGLAFLSYFTLERGLLTGRMQSDRIFRTGDTRRGNQQFSRDSISRIDALLKKFGPVAESHGATVAQVVIALTTSQRGVTHALIGARSAAQARENARGGCLRLSKEETAALEQAVGEFAAGSWKAAGC